MAKKTVVVIICDRCGHEDETKTVPTRGGIHGAKITTPHGGQFIIRGMDLCGDCQGDLETFMNNMTLNIEEPATAK
jgi:hypothetical protein